MSALGELRDVLLGMLPHRARTGLLRIGNPGRGSPVLLTGNYTQTIRHMQKALAGQDVWLLCANSKGINVWCAAGGGHLTHHDVISVLRTSGVEEKVDQRELILPQLCATGVERKVVTERTGWTTRWGPARLEDLPAFLARGRRVHKAERFMRFPLADRLRMALMWGGPMLLFAAPVLYFLGGWRVMASAAPCVAVLVAGPFVALPWLGIAGKKRWLSLVLFGTAGFAVGAGALLLLSAPAPGHFLTLAIAATVLSGVLSVDLAGTTPWYPSTINTGKNPATVELVEERCTGAADCVQVCPRDVLKMNGQRRKVEIRKPEQCIQCGACIVQCPEDALRFRYKDGTVVEADVIRRTRMNMLGKRTVEVRETPQR